VKRWPSDLWLAADRPKRWALEKKWAARPQRVSLPVAPGSSPLVRRPAGSFGSPAPETRAMSARGGADPFSPQGGPTRQH